MELSEIYQNTNKYNISFEIFPPKNGDISKLFDELRILKKYNPALVSLTYGANGSTRNFSIELLQMILDLELNPMPHFTCVCTTRELIEHYIVQIENMGIENILALRGDKSGDENLCSLDFQYANELVDFIHQKTTLSIGVGGYPQGHPQAVSLEKDIENLKRKVDAGASAIFTQLFFENDKFYKYVEHVRKAGIDIPIIAGIMPVRSLEQAQKMVEMTRVQIPQTLQEKLEKYPNDSKKFGIDYAIEQCQNLISNNVSGLHFYTLNKSDMVSEILDRINS
ncbi:methylenetetrahydrofolate reductase [bacterium]|nr:methylenetetrahydrofolate reductase [NAD(P)H] [bacterium]